MPTVQNQRRFSPEQLLTAIDEIDASELRLFVSQVVARAARRMAPSLPQREAELLQKINRGLPRNLNQRSRSLIEKRRADSLSPAERQELLNLTGEAEKWQAERAGYLVELAEIRGTSPSRLMDDLGIEPPPVE